MHGGEDAWILKSKATKPIHESARGEDLALSDYPIPCRSWSLDPPRIGLTRESS